MCRLLVEVFVIQYNSYIMKITYLQIFLSNFELDKLTHNSAKFIFFILFANVNDKRYLISKGIFQWQLPLNK